MKNRLAVFGIRRNYLKGYVSIYFFRLVSRVKLLELLDIKVDATICIRKLKFFECCLSRDISLSLDIELVIEGVEGLNHFEKAPI